MPLRIPTEWLNRLLKRSKLSQTQQELLNLLRQDNLRAGLPFKASEMWQELSRQFDAVFRSEGINIPETQLYNTMFSQSLPGNARYHRYAHWLLYSAIKQKDRLNILERVNATIHPDTGLAYIFNGVPISWDLLISTDSLYAIADVCPGIFTEPLVVADLGAGWGRMGYVLKKINPRCTYVIFDLPEPLLISTTRLPQLLPDEKAISYQDLKAMPIVLKKDLTQGGLWFCGSQDLDRFEDRSIDVFINISSFQEMTREQVSAYFSFIDRKVKGIFYTQQYWSHPELKSRYGVLGGFDEYPFPQHWRKHYMRNATFSERYFEAAFAIE